jgi:hypothetical protein
LLASGRWLLAQTRGLDMSSSSLIKRLPGFLKSVAAKNQVPAASSPWPEALNQMTETLN